MEGEPRFVGIDVSKAQLDVAVRPTGKRWVLPYDETGIEGLIPQIVDLEPALVLLEATGGLEVSECQSELRPPEQTRFLVASQRHFRLRQPVRRRRL